MDWAQCDSSEFEETYGELTALEVELWSDVNQKVHSILAEDQQFVQYSSAEKLLAYYYTLLQTLSEEQTSYENMLADSNTWLALPKYLSSFRGQFLEFMQVLVNQGIDEGTITSRFTLSNYYKQGLWLQCLFILNFWSKDKSADKSASDEAVERAVVLSFDLMGHNALDSAAGLGKFLFKKR
jgi:hypothetical protein